MTTRLRYWLRVYGGAVRLGFKQGMGERITLVGSIIMYATLIVAYGGVFRAIAPEELAPHHLTSALLIWYLGVTEFVLFCGTFAHYRELQHDIETDQIHIEILRPCPLWIVRVGEWSGQYGARFAVQSIPCLIIVALTAGGNSPTWQGLSGVVGSLPLAGLVILITNFLLGASCLWLRQAEPIFWIWQKALFLLGALLWPLALYPNIVHKLTWLTPFPAILAVPGAWITPDDLVSHNQGLLIQLFWGAIFIALAIVVNRRLVLRVQRDGLR